MVDSREAHRIVSFSLLLSFRSQHNRFILSLSHQHKQQTGTIFIAINFILLISDLFIFLFLIDFPYNVCDSRSRRDIYKIAKLFLHQHSLHFSSTAWKKNRRKLFTRSLNAREKKRSETIIHHRCLNTFS